MLFTAPFLSVFIRVHPWQKGLFTLPMLIVFPCIYNGRVS
jgi:hypothetical protein